MKKTAVLIPVLVALTACSSMKAVETRKTYAQPKWYQSCVQSGKEGYFWREKEYVYSCGAGESRYMQAAEEQMYAVAMNNFAKRINGKVNSSTDISIVNEKKTTKTVISYTVSSTSVREHLMQETGTFNMDGKFYTFVRLKMPKNAFDTLIKESNGG
jgi:hypothetical protein